MTAMAPQIAYTMKRKLQPDSNALRIHFLHGMKRKPHLHDGTVLVMVDTGNNNLFGRIASSGLESPDVRLTRIW